MKYKFLFRYTSNGEGIFSIGKRLLPENLVKEVIEAKTWLKKPKLPKGEYRFYLTAKGKEKYEKTLLKSHKKYLSNIKLHKIKAESVKTVIYEDEYQVVEKIS